MALQDKQDTNLHERAQPHLSVAVAFCADQHMEAALHVAMKSLLTHLDARYSAHFYLILTGFSADRLQRLHKTLNATCRDYSLTLLDPVDNRLFAGFPPLHGVMTIYHRLMLPELVNEPRLLYLDSDLSVLTDIAPLFTLDMHSTPVGFVLDGVVAGVLDRDFQLSQGRALDGPTFNSGLVLFNLPEWRRQNCTEKVFAFGRQHGARLINRDQTLLNALFADHCCPLDRKYNITVKPTTDPASVPSEGIIHYYGSPKPWDLGARFLHRFARAWFAQLRQTALPFSARCFWLNQSAWKRLPKIAGGYRQAIRMRLLGHSN